MALVDRVVRFATSPTGAALDRHCVRWSGHSPVSWLFARASGQPYNRPLLLTTRGRRTGRARSVVLPYFPAPAGADDAGHHDAVAVVGSRGGMPTDPHWIANLRAEAACRIRIGRRPRDVRARIAEGEERAALWKEITARAPVYLEYAERARPHREIPVVILESAGASRAGLGTR